MDDFKKQIEQAEKDIVECVVLSLENGNIKEEDLPEIGQFVLDKIDLLKTHEELSAFLMELSSKWPIFLNIAKIEKGELQERAESETADSVLTLLKHGKIDDALSLAKSETNK